LTLDVRRQAVVVRWERVVRLGQALAAPDRVRSNIKR
jgi:hypothetical protein